MTSIVVRVDKLSFVGSGLAVNEKSSQQVLPVDK